MHSYQKGRPIGGGAIAFLAAATMLAGCAGAPGTPPLAPEGQILTSEPAASRLFNIGEMKRALLAGRARLWKDPKSVRAAKIGPAMPCPGPSATGEPNTCVCIEAESRNSHGGPTGLQTYLIVFKAPESFQGLGTIKYDRADCGALAPFPEMNGKRR